MRKIAIIVIICMLCFKSFSQFSFPSDTKTNWFSKHIFKRLKNSFQFEKKVDFEFRFIEIYSLTREMKIFILTNKNRKWSARYFESDPKDKLSKFIEKSVDNKDLDIFWQDLNKNNVLLIKEDKYLKDSLGEIASVAISDGIRYSFDLISKKNKRNYTYHCPENNSKQYPYIQEFKWVTNIITLIYQKCNFEIKDICKSEKRRTTCGFVQVGL